MLEQQTGRIDGLDSESLGSVLQTTYESLINFPRNPSLKGMLYLVQSVELITKLGPRPNEQDLSNAAQQHAPEGHAGWPGQSVARVSEYDGQGSCPK